MREHDKKSNEVKWPWLDRIAGAWAIEIAVRRLFVDGEARTLLGQPSERSHLASRRAKMAIKCGYRDAAQDATCVALARLLVDFGGRQDILASCVNGDEIRRPLEVFVPCVVTPELHSLRHHRPYDKSAGLKE
jgi:hypothetical protein